MYAREHTILRKVTKADVKMDPFPHLVVKDAVDPDLYEKLSLGYPSLSSLISTGVPIENNKAYTKAAKNSLVEEETPAVWHDFIAMHIGYEFWRDSVEIFSGAIEHYYPEISALIEGGVAPDRVGLRTSKAKAAIKDGTYDFVTDCQISYNTPVTRQSSVRSCHIDSPFELIAGLLYLREPTDTSQGGNLQLFRYRNGQTGQFTPDMQIDHRHVDLLEEIPYTANTLVMFLNSPVSLHGVSQRSLTQTPRRLVNFLIERYVSPEGLFRVPMKPFPLRDRIARKLKTITAHRHLLTSADMRS